MPEAIICYMANSDQIQTKMLSKIKTRKATKNSKYFLLPFFVDNGLPRFGSRSRVFKTSLCFHGHSCLVVCGSLTLCSGSSWKSLNYLNSYKLNVEVLSPIKRVKVESPCRIMKRAEYQSLMSSTICRLVR